MLHLTSLTLKNMEKNSFVYDVTNVLMEEIVNNGAPNGNTPKE